MTPAQIVHEKAQLGFWWCGIGFVVFFGVGMMNLMGFIPPPSPLLSGGEVIAKYQDNILLLRTGIVTCLLGCGCLILWNIVMAVQVKRLEEGRQLPLYAIASLVSGTVNAVFFILPYVFWAATFFRVDRNPELIQLLNDMTWLEFVMIAAPASIQTLCIGIAVLTSSAKTVVIPRWYGFLCLWMTVLALPGMLALYFLSGPFAWNGVISFWVPIATFSVYMTCSFVVFYKAIKTHKDEVVV